MPSTNRRIARPKLEIDKCSNLKYFGGLTNEKANALVSQADIVLIISRYGGSRTHLFRLGVMVPLWSVNRLTLIMDWKTGAWGIAREMSIGSTGLLPSWRDLQRHGLQSRREALNTVIRGTRRQMRRSLRISCWILLALRQL
jgi:hypothetical protein